MASVVLFSFVLTPLRAFSDEPKPIIPIEEAPKPPPGAPIVTEIKQHLDWWTSWTVNLNAAVAGILALNNIPGAIESAKKAYAEIHALKENQEAYQRALEQVEKIKEKQPFILNELGKALERYGYRLNLLEMAVARQLKEETVTPQELHDVLNPVIESMEKLKQFVPPAEKRKIVEIQSRWNAYQDIDLVDKWVKTNAHRLKGPNEGREWLSHYLSVRRDWAAKNWFIRGTMLQMEKSAKLEAALEKQEKTPKGSATWTRDFNLVRKEEQAAAKDFIRDFATFVRSANVEIEEGDKKFPILIEFTAREPGEFHLNSEVGLVSFLSKNIGKQIGERQCKILTEQVNAKVSALEGKVSITGRVLQRFKVAAPILGSGVAVASLATILKNVFWPSPVQPGVVIHNPPIILGPSSSPTPKKSQPDAKEHVEKKEADDKELEQIKLKEKP